MRADAMMTSLRSAIDEMYFHQWLSVVIITLAVLNGY